MTDYQSRVAARLPLHGRLFDPLYRLFDAWRRRRRFATLRDLDDRQLQDIGLTRDDVAWGMNLPIRENAAMRIRLQRQERRALES